jgi:hypothetical protein
LLPTISIGADFSMTGAEEMQISMDFVQYSYECPEAEILDSSYGFLEHANPPPPPPKKKEKC